MFIKHVPHRILITISDKNYNISDRMIQNKIGLYTYRILHLHFPEVFLPYELDTYMEYIYDLKYGQNAMYPDIISWALENNYDGYKLKELIALAIINQPVPFEISRLLNISPNIVMYQPIMNGTDWFIFIIFSIFIWLSISYIIILFIFPISQYNLYMIRDFFYM